MSAWLPPRWQKISWMNRVLKSLAENDRINYGGTEYGDIFYFGRDNDTKDMRTSQVLYGIQENRSVEPFSGGLNISIDVYVFQNISH